MQRSGFDCLAAIDFNPEAVATLRANLQAKSPSGLKPVAFALETDFTTLATETLAAVIGTRPVDVIVGGRSCQGFSTARLQSRHRASQQRPASPSLVRQAGCTSRTGYVLHSVSSYLRSISDSTWAVQM